MDIWFALVFLHVQRPDLIQFNSLIHPLSGMCDTSLKQFCQIISPPTPPISNPFNKTKIFYSMVWPFQFHLKSDNMCSGITVVPLLCRRALFAFTHPNKDNRSQLSCTTDFIITLKDLSDRSVPTKACQEKPIRILNKVKLVHFNKHCIKITFLQCRIQQISY